MFTSRTFNGEPLNRFSHSRLRTVGDQRNEHLIALSTPSESAVWSDREWSYGADAWERAKFAAQDWPLSRSSFWPKERKQFREFRHSQEYECRKSSVFTSELIDRALDEEGEGALAVFETHSVGLRRTRG
jgi:hypothetical protein